MTSVQLVSGDAGGLKLMSVLLHTHTHTPMDEAFVGSIYSLLKHFNTIPINEQTYEHPLYPTWIIEVRVISERKYVSVSF